MILRMMEFKGTDILFSISTAQLRTNINPPAMYQCNISVSFDSNDSSYHYIEKSRYGSNGVRNGGLFDYTFDYDKNYYAVLDYGTLVHTHKLTDIIGLPYDTKLLKFDLRQIDLPLLYNFILATRIL